MNKKDITYKSWVLLYNEETKRIIKDGGGGDNFNTKICVWLEEVLLKAKKHYYTTGEVIMDDTTYDNFEDTLKRLKPDSEVLSIIGYKELYEKK